MPELLDAARAYYDIGLSIFPVSRGTKFPALRSWKKYQSERTTRRQVAEWWRHSQNGIAVVMGEVSDGLMCRDFDIPEAYHSWAEEHPDLANTLPTTQTGCGYHVYFKGDAPSVAAEIQSGCHKTSDGELRVSGCFCILPPSEHELGQKYQFLRPLQSTTPYVDDVCDVFLPKCSLFTQKTHEYTGRHRNSGILPTVLAADCAPPLLTADQWLLDCISPTLPLQHGDRHRCLLRYWRKAKSHPEVNAMSLDDLLPYIRQWFNMALPFISTKDFTVTLMEFRAMHKKIKHAEGDGALTTAWEIARRSTPSLPLEADIDPRVGTLDLLCQELQRLSGNEPFFLSCRSAGTLLGVSHVQANNWLAYLEHCAKTIRTVEKGSQARRQASTFVHLGDLDLTK